MDSLQFVRVGKKLNTVYRFKTNNLLIANGQVLKFKELFLNQRNLLTCHLVSHIAHCTSASWGLRKVHAFQRFSPNSTGKQFFHCLSNALDEILKERRISKRSTLRIQKRSDSPVEHGRRLLSDMRGRCRGCC